MLPLKAMPGSQGLLDALNRSCRLRSYREEWIDVTPKLDLSFLRPRLASARHAIPTNRVFITDVSSRSPSFFELAEALQSGEIYVPGSRNYDTYTDRLYPIESDPQAVSAYLKARGLPDNAEAFVTSCANGWTVISVVSIPWSVSWVWCS